MSLFKKLFLLGPWTRLVVMAILVYPIGTLAGVIQVAKNVSWFNWVFLAPLQGWILVVSCLVLAGPEFSAWYVKVKAEAAEEAKNAEAQALAARWEEAEV